MTTTIRTFCAIGSVLAMTACGGTSVSFEEKLEQRLEEAQARLDRVKVMEPSSSGVVTNARGTMNFSGEGTVIAGPANDGAVLVGDADLTVRFGTNSSVSGSISNFAGVGGVNANIRNSGTLAPYSGRITLSGGSVGAGNRMEVDYRGTLRGNGDTMVFDGNMTGGFLGNPSITGVTAVAQEPSTYNGRRYTSIVAIVAEPN